MLIGITDAQMLEVVSQGSKVLLLARIDGRGHLLLVNIRGVDTIILGLVLWLNRHGVPLVLQLILQAQAELCATDESRDLLRVVQLTLNYIGRKKADGALLLVLQLLLQVSHDVVFSILGSSPIDAVNLIVVLDDYHLAFFWHRDPEILQELYVEPLAMCSGPLCFGCPLAIYKLLEQCQSIIEGIDVVASWNVEITIIERCRLIQVILTLNSRGLLFVVAGEVGPLTGELPLLGTPARDLGTAVLVRFVNTLELLLRHLLA